MKKENKKILYPKKSNKKNLSKETKKKKIKTNKSNNNKENNILKKNVENKDDSINISKCINTRIDYIDNLFNKRLKINKINNQYISFIIPNNILKSEDINLIKIDTDGNCYFRAVSRFLIGSESKYDLVRMAIYNKKNII